MTVFSQKLLPGRRLNMFSRFLLLGLVCSSATVSANVCRYDRELCQQRNNVRMELKQLFYAARDNVLSLSEYQRLAIATEQAKKVAEGLQLLGYGRGFVPRYAQKSQRLLDQFESGGDGRFTLVVKESVAQQSDETHQEAMALGAAEVYMQSGLRWREFKMQKQYPSDLYPKIRYYVQMTLMTQPIACEYDADADKTHIRSEDFSLGGQLSGNQVALCQSSAYQGARLLMLGRR